MRKGGTITSVKYVSGYEVGVTTRSPGGEEETIYFATLGHEILVGDSCFISEEKGFCIWSTPGPGGHPLSLPLALGSWGDQSEPIEQGA